MDQENSVKLLVILSGALFGLVTVSKWAPLGFSNSFKFIGFGLTFIAQEVKNDEMPIVRVSIGPKKSWKKWQDLNSTFRIGFIFLKPPKSFFLNVK